jgi:hypothetical protein
MGEFLPSYKKAIIEELISSITSNTSQYYTFVANPVPFIGDVPVIANNEYTTNFTNNWQMIFGKRLANTDIIPMIANKQWASNTVYAMYDNTNSQYTTSNTSFYVITPPAVYGGPYDVYKCLNNANGGSSTVIPSQMSPPASFTTSDGYIWKYITSISAATYGKFATDNYAPISVNAVSVSAAYNYSGVDTVMINNGGTGYISVANGVVQGKSNSTYIQIQTANTSGVNDFYTKNAIYFENSGSSTSQLRTIVKYESVLGANYVTVDSPLDLTKITAGGTTYRISPAVVFQTDGVVDPVAYTEINTDNYSITNVVIIDPGYGVSWANVTIQSNTSYGTGANVYAIVPPPGGHGSDPMSELNVLGYGIAFHYANNELDTIPTNVTYNKIGLIKNPYGINNTTGAKTINRYSANTFNCLFEADVSPALTFSVGEVVTGGESGALGTVAFSNSTVVYLTGDKNFINAEYIVSANGTATTQISINSRGQIYTKDIHPLYVQNITNVTRDPLNSESFKFVIQV